MPRYEYADHDDKCARWYAVDVKVLGLKCLQEFKTSKVNWRGVGTPVLDISTSVGTTRGCSKHMGSGHYI
nr:hypothetical protein CFP56_06155 [Quercus suber]